MTRQRLLETVGRSARLKLLNELKRTPAGLPVKELAARLGMSYMGIKDLCVDLHRRGLLETWRQSQKLGRPLMLYRLSERANELFTTVSNALTIELLGITQKVYGPAAPEKLLLHVFQQKTAAYKAKLKGETLEQRAESLARLRESEGSMSAVEKTDAGGLTIVEHHSLLLDVLAAFPIVAKLEAEMFRQLLQAPVERSEERVAGLFCARFRIG